MSSFLKPGMLPWTGEDQLSKPFLGRWRGVALFMLLLLPIACQKRGGQENPWLIDPADRVGPVRQGMTSEEVVQALGTPADRKTDPNSGALLSLDYPDVGLEVVFAEQGEIETVIAGAQFGRELKRVDAFRGVTAEGIGMGSSKEKIIRAFGKPDDVRLIKADPNVAWKPPQDTEVLVYYDRLKFSLVDNRLIELWVTFTD